MYAYNHYHPTTRVQKEYVLKEIRVQPEIEVPPAIEFQPELPSRPAMYPNVCRIPGVTCPPPGAAQQDLPAVPMNPSYPSGLGCYTRPQGDAEQVGTLTPESRDGKILPLFAQRSATNRDRYHYWTRTGDYQPIVLPVKYKNRDCMSTTTFGCEIIYTGDRLHVPDISGEAFIVNLYRNLY